MCFVIYIFWWERSVDDVSVAITHNGRRFRSRIGIIEVFVRSSSANGKSGRSSWGSEVLPHQPRRVQVNFVSVNTNNRFDVTTLTIGHQLWQRELSKTVSIDGNVGKSVVLCWRMVTPRYGLRDVRVGRSAFEILLSLVLHRCNPFFRYFLVLVLLQLSSVLFRCCVLSPLSIHFTCLPFLDMISQSTLADTFTRRLYPG